MLFSALSSHQEPECLWPSMVPDREIPSSQQEFAPRASLKPHPRLFSHLSSTSHGSRPSPCLRHAEPQIKAEDVASDEKLRDVYGIKAKSLFSTPETFVFSRHFARKRHVTRIFSSSSHLHHGDKGLGGHLHLGDLAQALLALLLPPKQATRW